MNRGNIPGYYYDEQQKKYFKIQANHLVPNGAKYAKGTVKLENRAKRKRKTDNDRQLRRERQTIKAAPVLKLAITGGMGLVREHGSFPKKTAALAQVENAFVSQLQPQSIHCPPPQPRNQSRLQDARYVPEIEQMVIARTNASCGRCVVYTVTDWQWNESPRTEQYHPLVAFNSAVSAVATHNIGRYSGWALVCASQHQTGNVASVSLPGPYYCEGETATNSGFYCTIGGTGSTIGDCSINPTTDSAAIIGSSGIYELDYALNVKSSYPISSDPDWPHCELSINWINPNVLLYGSKAEEQRGYSAMLWDTRTSDGKTARFNVRERLTGVFNPGNYGAVAQYWQYGLQNDFEILASSNRRIDLFDMRMPATGRLSNAPVYSFKHVHGGPRLQRAAAGNLLAAVDSDNIVQIYSLRTGAKIDSLKAPVWKPLPMESPMFRQLMWYDDVDRGLCLQAVRGNSIVRWSWGGGDDGDSEEE